LPITNLFLQNIPSVKHSMFKFGTYSASNSSKRTISWSNKCTLHHDNAGPRKNSGRAIFGQKRMPVLENREHGPEIITFYFNPRGLKPVHNRLLY
jgi:hypothetical protein